MPYIQNVSMRAIRNGDHWHTPNDVLIQITDSGYPPPVPKYEFAKVYQFQFMDIEESEKVVDMELACSYNQASTLAAILQDSLHYDHNVIVHCHAGLCRSGAVAEIGVMMGFEDTGVARMPNLLVKKRMMQALGWGYYD